MTIYINTKTKVRFSSDSDISGGDWVKLEDEVEKETKTQNVDDPVEQADDKVEEVEEINLPKMTIAELQDFAKENKIEIPNDVTKKDDIIAVIAEAFQE